MAWRDPYHHRGFVYIHQPEIVYQGVIENLHYWTGAAIIDYVLMDATPITGALTDIVPNMLMYIGSNPGGHDRGQIRVRSVNTGSRYIYAWGSLNNHDQEWYPEIGDFVTVLKFYPLVMKPPYAEAGNYYYDVQGPQGATYDQIPIANGGPGDAGFVDKSTYVRTVSFDAASSFAVADDAQLGGLTSSLFLGSYTLTASEGTPANMLDGDTGTNWQATAYANAGDWAKVDWGAGNEQSVRQMTIQVGTSGATYGPGTFCFQYSDDDMNWITAFYGLETSWSSLQTRTYDIHWTGYHRYWRLVVFGSVTGNLFGIVEWRLYGEDRTAGTSPYAWTIPANGTIVSGSSTSESIDVEFTHGADYVDLAVTDTNAQEGVTHIPVMADYPLRGVLADPDTELDFTGATFTGLGTDPSYPAGNGFDDTIARWQSTLTANTYLRVQFPTAKWLGSYDIQCYIPSYAPQQMQIRGSDNGSTWTTIDSQTLTFTSSYETQSFTLTPTTKAYIYYELRIITNGGSGVGTAVAEWNLYPPAETPTADLIVRNVNVRSLTMEPMGQVLELNVWEALPIQSVSESKTEADHSLATKDASATAGGSSASNAFDNNNSTYWATPASTTTGWLRVYDSYYWANSVKAYGIYIDTAWLGYAPVDFELQGTDDPTVDWTTLDVQRGITWTGSAQEQVFPIYADRRRWLQYRLRVTKNNGQNALIINELNLYTQTEDITPQYIDGALVMHWEEAYYDLIKGNLASAGVSGREHMIVIGWIDSEPSRFEGIEIAVNEEVTLRCLDAGQRLNQLADFTFMAQRDAAPAYGYEMKHATMDTFFYLMARWLSTAAEVTDFFWSNTADHYNIGLLAAQGASIYDMIHQKAMAIDHLFTCNKNGQLKIVPDLLTCANEFRAGAPTAETLTAADYGTFEAVYSSTSKLHWLYGSGVGFLPYDADHGSFAADARFTISPGQAPGQGAGGVTDHERLFAESDLGDGRTYHQWSSLYERLGHSYAQQNAAWSPFTLTLMHDGDTGLDPAEAEWLKLTLPSTLTTYRPRALSAARAVIRRIDIRPNANTLSKAVRLEGVLLVENVVSAWGYAPS